MNCNKFYLGLKQPTLSVFTQVQMLVVDSIPFNHTSKLSADSLENPYSNFEILQNNRVRNRITNTSSKTLTY